MPILRPIHSDSHPVADMEFNVINDVPVTNVDVMAVRERDVTPQSLSPDTPTAAIEFRFDTAADEWIRWRDTLLCMKLQVKLEKTGGGTISETDWANVLPAQNLLHSMFKNVEINVNQRELCVAPQTYAYQAYLTNLLTTTVNCKETLLKDAGYYIKEADRRKWLVPSGTDKSKAEVELMDALHVCFTEQTKALLGGCRVVLKLIPHSPDFYFKINGTSLKLSVKIIDPILRLRMAVTNPILTQKFREALAKPDIYAKYFFRRVNVLSFVAEKTHLYVQLHNVLNGQLPRRLFLMMVSHKAFNGSSDTDPFEFKHNKITEAVAFIDGSPFPDRPFKPDFTNGICAREYRALYEALQQDNYQPVLQMSKSDFINNNTILAFNFAPDWSGGPGPTSAASLVKHGNLRIDLKFAEGLPETTTILVYCEFDNHISFDGLGNVVTDYM